ncbi:MAG: hypothetical protein ABFE07_05930 [Armatimonadia bacterium]
MKRLAPLMILILALSLLAGCGGGKPKSARAVADSYLSYMKGGKYLEAAKLWDYETDARKQNEDWDSIVESQRTLIIDKLAEEKAESLKMWEGYFPPATKITEFNETGDSAHAALDGGRVSALDLKLVSEEWRITGM